MAVFSFFVPRGNDLMPGFQRRLARALDPPRSGHVAVEGRGNRSARLPVAVSVTSRTRCHRSGNNGEAPSRPRPIEIDDEHRTQIEAVKALELFSTPATRLALTDLIENEQCFYKVRCAAAFCLAKVNDSLSASAFGSARPSCSTRFRWPTAWSPTGPDLRRCS